MRIIQISQIRIPDNRQRKEIDPESLNSLIESIKSKGLLHPPVVAEEPDGFRLVVGERRLRAIQSLYELEIPIKYGKQEIPLFHLPVNLLSELDELMLKEIEFEENTIRTDLTWQEVVKAQAELDALRRTQNSNHTISDTAREVFGKSGGDRSMAIRESIILAQHLNDPDISKAQTKTEALKILKAKKEAEHRERLTQTLDVSKTPHQLLEGDFLSLIYTIPSGTVDTVITDPPYGIDAIGFNQAFLPHNYNDSAEDVDLLISLLARESFRITKQSAHAFCFCSPDRFWKISAFWRDAGWDVWPRPLIWYKGNLGFIPRPGYGPRYTYETIIFAIKGDKKVLATKHDVLIHQSPAEKLHAAQKPVELFVDLLSTSCLPGDTILDPFIGSGTSFKAANVLKLRAIGIEKDPAAIVLAKLAMLEG